MADSSNGYRVEEGLIVIHRDLTALDLFLRDFLAVLKKYADYLVVSGFVSISTGRVRGTEDIDVLVPQLEKEEFSRLFDDLSKNGFWCYQGNASKEIFPYIKELTSIRFARTDEVFPNIEFIPITPARKAKYYEFSHPQLLKVEDFEFKVPPLEFEILYKEIILRSKKDLEDARHLRAFFSDILDNARFKEYEKIIRQEL